MDLDSVLNWLRGGATAQPAAPKAFPTGPSNYIPASQNPPYPSPSDVDFARKQDYSYGQPWAPEFQGQSARLITSDKPLGLHKLYSNEPITEAYKGQTFGGPKYERFLSRMDEASPYNKDDPLRDLHARAALASERSGLAKLGYDPTAASLDTFRDPVTNPITGLTDTDTGKMYANAWDPSAIIHESIHRGTIKLRNSPYWNKEFEPFEPGKSSLNELLVRHLMATKMGDPEQDSGDKYAKEQVKKLKPSALSIIDKMEDAAAQAYAARRPGGPR